MIRLLDQPLTADTLGRLEAWQATLDAIDGYEARVAEAGRLWKARRSDAAMVAVAERLAEISSGVRRCNYCEDSAGYQIEHVEPKSFYPERTFRWDNMAFACGWCNGPKNNQHAVFLAATSQFKEIVRKRGEPVEPPPPGTSVLINPRAEDPSPFLHLDLLDTFLITARIGLSPRDTQRANYTIDLLRLNKRDALVESRRNAYQVYVALTERIIRLRREDGSEAVQELAIAALKRGSHRYVWLEIKRQRALLPELNALFDEAPDATTW